MIAHYLIRTQTRMALETKWYNKRSTGNQSVHVPKQNTSIMFLSAKKNGKHQRFVLRQSSAVRGNYWSCLLCSHFLIKPARSSLGWKMCSIQWNGYLHHDEWAVISNCCWTSVSLTPGDSGCSSSVVQLHIVWRLRVTPSANVDLRHEARQPSIIWKAVTENSSFSYQGCPDKVG